MRVLTKNKKAPVGYAERKKLQDRKYLLEKLAKVQSKVLKESEVVESPLFDLKQAVLDLVDIETISSYQEINDEDFKGFQITVPLVRLSDLYENYGLDEAEEVVEAAFKSAGEPFDLEIVQVEEDENFATFMVTLKDEFFLCECDGDCEEEEEDSEQLDESYFGPQDERVVKTVGELLDFIAFNVLERNSSVKVLDADGNLMSNGIKVSLDDLEGTELVIQLI